MVFVRKINVHKMTKERMKVDRQNDGGCTMCWKCV